MGESPLISLCIPVYQESENIDRLLAALHAFTVSEPAYRFEFVFTDNASTDDTFEKLVTASRNDARIRVLRLSRNFGFQRSMLTNYFNSRGDAAVQVDADLQDPPEMIREFLRLWEQGYKVVYGVRRKRQESKLLSVLRSVGYWVISTLSDSHLPRDSGDFRLIDRLVIDELRNFEHGAPYLRGLIASIGYAQTGVPYDRHARQAGSSKFGLWALLRFGMDGICSHSTKPLQFITFFGVVVGFSTVALGLYYLIRFFVDQSLPVGFTTIVLLLLASVSVNTIFLGVIGEYVGRTFRNSQQEPLTIIAERVESVDLQGSIYGDNTEEPST